MAVAFNQIGSDTRVPLFTAEFNAGTPPYSGISPAVIVAHKLAGGFAPVGALTNVGGVDPVAIAGLGSMAADMILHARRANPFGEMYLLPIAEPTGGTPASGAITFTGTATSTGTFRHFIAGEPVSINVAVGMTAAQAAAALVAAIGAGYVKFNRRMGFPVTAATNATPGAVVVTARHAGALGNGINLDEGLDGYVAPPAGLTAAITAMVGGAGDVDVAAGLALLGSSPADFIIAPFVTAAQLNAVRDYLSDAGSGRWAPGLELYGHYFSARAGGLSDQTAFGTLRNDRHTSVLAVNGGSHPLWVFAAALGGHAARSKNLGTPLTEAIEIARPLRFVLEGLRAPKNEADRWDRTDRESLYRNGMSACVVLNDGQLKLDLVITLYQKNEFDRPDTTFLKFETLAISAYVGRYFRQQIETTYPRHVLKDDNPGGIQGVVTPPLLKAACVHIYQDLYIRGGVVEKPEIFARELIIERSSSGNRANGYLPIDAANQFDVFAANITIFTEYQSLAFLRV